MSRLKPQTKFMMFLGRLRLKGRSSIFRPSFFMGKSGRYPYTKVVGVNRGIPKYQRDKLVRSVWPNSERGRECR